MEVPEDASKINIETDILETMGNILSTSQENQQDTQETTEKQNETTEEVMEPSNVFPQKQQKDDVDEYTKNLSAQDINLIIMGKSSDDSQSVVTDELWLQSSQELKNVRVDTDEDFEVIVKSLETAIESTESYETKTDDNDLVKVDLDVKTVENVKKTSDKIEKPSSSSAYVVHCEDTNESEDFTLRLEEEDLDHHGDETKRITSSISEEVVTSSTPDLEMENVTCGKIEGCGEETNSENAEGGVTDVSGEAEKVSDTIEKPEDINIKNKTDDEKIETEDVEKKTEADVETNISISEDEIKNILGIENEDQESSSNKTELPTQGMSESSLISITDSDSVIAEIKSKTETDCPSIITQSSSENISESIDPIIIKSDSVSTLEIESKSNIDLENESTPIEFKNETENSSVIETSVSVSENLSIPESKNEVSLPENKNVSIPENESVSILKNENISLPENETNTENTIESEKPSIIETKIIESENVPSEIIEKIENVENVKHEAANETIEAQKSSDTDTEIKKPEPENKIVAKDETDAESIKDSKTIPDKIEDTSTIPPLETEKSSICEEPLVKITKTISEPEKLVEDKPEESKSEIQENLSPQKIKLIRDKPKVKGKKVVQKPEMQKPLEKPEPSVVKSDLPLQKVESSQPIEIAEKIEVSSQKIEESSEKIEPTLQKIEPPQPPQKVELSSQKPEVSSQKSEESKPDVSKKEESMEVTETKTPQKLKLTRNYRVPKSAKKPVQPEVKTEETKRKEEDIKAEKEIKMTEEQKIMEVEVEKMVSEMEANVKGVKENIMEINEDVKTVESVEEVKEVAKITEVVKEVIEEIKVEEVDTKIEVQQKEVVQEKEVIETEVKEIVKELEVKEVLKHDIQEEVNVKEVEETVQVPQEALKEIEEHKKETENKIEVNIDVKEVTTEEQEKEIETENKIIVETVESTTQISETEKESTIVSDIVNESATVDDIDQKSVINIDSDENNKKSVDETDKSATINTIENILPTITAPINKPDVMIETDTKFEEKLMIVSESDKKSETESKIEEKPLSQTDIKLTNMEETDKISATVAEIDKISATVSETDKKSVIEVETDKKLPVEIETDKKSVAEVETEIKLVAEVEPVKKLVAEVETDKKLVTVDEPEIKSVPVSESVPKSTTSQVKSMSTVTTPSVRIASVPKIGLETEKELKVVIEKDIQTLPVKSQPKPEDIKKPSEDIEENIEDMLPKTIISRTVQEMEQPTPEPVEEVPVKIPKKRGRKKKVIPPPSEVQPIDTTPTVMVTRRGSTRLSTRMEEIQKPSVSIQHIPAKRPAEIEPNKITKKMRETETIIIDDEDKNILNKVDDLIDNRESPKFDQSTNESFLKIVSVCSIAEEPKRIEPITKPLRVEVDLDESLEDQRNVPKITITKQRASPKIRIKPIIKPEEKNSPSDSTPRVIIKPIKQDPLKITITKQSDDSHSILKIYKPEEHEETVPKLTIKPIPKPDEMQHSPRTMKIIKQNEIGPNITVKPIMSCEMVTSDTHSPKSRKTEENYPKVTIKPILRPDEAQKSPLSPRQTLKMKAFESSGITMEPIMTSPNSEINPLKIKQITKQEEPLSPKLTIKPIAKTCEIVQSEDGTSNPLKLTIKPLKDDAHQSPKITIKPVLKPEELPAQEEDKPERIILKIQKTNLPSPKERTSMHVKEKDIRTEPGENNEKLGKIKLKLMKEAGHAQIIPSQIINDNQLKRTLLTVGESTPEKRPRQELGPEILHTSDISINIVEPNQPTYPKTVTEEVTIMKIDQNQPSSNILSRALTTPQQPSESKFKEMLLQIQQKRDLTCTAQNIQDQSSDSDDVRIVGIIPGDKPKDPVSVNEESSSQDVIIISETINTNPFHDLQFIKTSDLDTSTTSTTEVTPDVTVTPIIPEVVAPTPKKRGRPRKNPLEVKPEIKGEDCIEIETRPKRTCRAPVGRAPYVVTERKPRGRGGGRGRGRGGRGGSSPKPGKETKSPRGRKSLKAQFSRLYAEPDEAEINLVPEPASDVTNTENIDKNLMKEPKVTGQISKVPTPIKDRKEIDPVPVFEEETRMSADNNNSRAQTPARQFVVPLPSEGPEESQSSVQSSTTTESGKNKKGRLEVIDYDVHVTVVDQIAEYSWGGGGPYMLQEQIAQYLGVKSFKRKYPGLTRRPVEMQERDFIREKNLVSESLCDMGLTAVPSSEILDIMYTDFQDKYEEYRKYMRDKQSKEISNKQKAISLATSQEKNKIDFKERAIKSAANWNSNFNKARKETRKCCVDLQTFTINYPIGQTHTKVPYKEPIGSYPIALVPGQFTDYYKPYSPAELNYLPLNTVRYGPLLPNLMCTDSGMSDGSVSDSESSSGSDSDSSDDSMSTVDDAPSSKANTPIPTSAPGTPKSMRA